MTAAATPNLLAIYRDHAKRWAAVTLAYCRGRTQFWSIADRVPQLVEVTRLDPMGFATVAGRARRVAARNLYLTRHSAIRANSQPTKGGRRAANRKA